MAKKAKVKRKLSPYNRHVQREMKKGRSMKQAAASWKPGRKRPSIRRSVSRAKPRRRAAAKTGGRKTMGKSGFNQQKIFKYVRLAALALPAADIALSGQSTETKIARAKKDYFGVDANGNFNLAYLAKGWLPFAASIGVTYGIPKLAGILRGL